MFTDTSEEARFNELVRDLTKVTPMSKSEVRRRIKEFVASRDERIKEMIEKYKDGFNSGLNTSLYIIGKEGV